MSRFCREEDWIPVGINDLEPNADAVVRSLVNILVVAGPGAGKTELLAQRANFLLETGRCPSPKRILAISFKRDAAKNLESRVRERCAGYADQFDSFTLDAFAKHIVDRFLLALPNAWQPKMRYQVRTASIKNNEAKLWLESASTPEGANRLNVQAWDNGMVDKVFAEVMHGVELPYTNPNHPEILRSLGTQWWREQLHLPEGTPSLTFPMLNRLAAYLFRCNPKVVAALHLTYSYVFLDEFQDTTASQWDLIISAFLDSKTVLTAVGDSKQRIMVWAGAKTDVFEKFQEEFSAERVDLVRNYRSLPELVRMQYVIAQVLEAGSVEPVAASVIRGSGLCQVIEFRSPEQESAYLADFIHHEIASGQALPHDYCVLVRQNVADMIVPLQMELGKRGILLRDESLLQDLRAEPLSSVVLLALRIATRIRDAQAWDSLVEELASLSGLDLEYDGLAVDRLALEHKRCVMEQLASSDGLQGLPLRLIKLLGACRYRSTYRQYTNGNYLEQVAKNLGNALQDSLDIVKEARFVPDDIAGINVVPAMTIHKSKGLEFETVIFLGLEDSQWWGFRYRPDEEKRAFFVAFSRAKKRVLFTWSDVRDDRYGRRRQQRQNIDALHAILAQAGVPTIDAR